MIDKDGKRFLCHSRGVHRQEVEPYDTTYGRWLLAFFFSVESSSRAASFAAEPGRARRASTSARASSSRPERWRASKRRLRKARTLSGPETRRPFAAAARSPRW